MGYLKTVLTYNLPSEAEVDKAFLESRGIAVCLLNANTSRNELGTPFYIQLQVKEEDAEAARRLIHEVNPQRFGSRARVDEIDRQVKRALAWFAMAAVPAGVAVGLATYTFTPNPARQPVMWARWHWVSPDVRVELSIAAAIAAGILVATLGRPGRAKAAAGPPAGRP